MGFKQEIIDAVWEGVYNKLNDLAWSEVGAAMQMPLIVDHRDNYYTPKYLVPSLLKEFELFEKKWLKVVPTDIIEILFKCRLLFAVQNHIEYRQRAGSMGSIHDENGFIILREKKALGLDALVEEYLDRLKGFQKERTLIAPINSFRDREWGVQALLDILFEQLNLPFKAYIQEDRLIEVYKSFYQTDENPSKENLERFCNFPAIWYTETWSYMYCYWQGITYLRTFINLLKIAGFLNPAQIEFDINDIQIAAPTWPVFLGSNSRWWYAWSEDIKNTWQKIPDGCLWRSFGYRWISKLRLDGRNYSKIEKFFMENKWIFDLIKNPRNKHHLQEIAPTLDILSSSTHTQDQWAKILLIYCSLEHLFVPKGIDTNNKTYIVGGINALNPDLLDWFRKLYELRCSYAHKWFIPYTDQLIGLVIKSVGNAMLLLSNKISNKNLNDI